VAKRPDWIYGLAIGISALLVVVTNAEAQIFCNSRTEAAIDNMNAASAMMKDLPGTISLGTKAWCADLRGKYKELLKAPDLIRECFPKDRQTHSIDGANKAISDVERVLSERCPLG
jgi:hypothetical protein